jgi:hypothetical protein
MRSRKLKPRTSTNVRSTLCDFFADHPFFSTRSAIGLGAKTAVLATPPLKS